MAKQTKVDLGNDTLDMQPVVDQAIRDERAEAIQAREFIRAVEKLQEKAHDGIKRWGVNEKLTIATPGHLIQDPTYIPETVELNDGTVRRVCKHAWIKGQFTLLTADAQKRYRWVHNHPLRFAVVTGMGFKFTSYKKTFADTALFTEGVLDRVVNGDNILMEIYLDGFEKLVKQVNELKAAYEGAASSELFDDGNRYGVPTFQENFKTGVREFYT